MANMRVLLLLSCCCAAIAVAEERAAWTTSKVTGSDEPPRPFVSEPLWPHITFDKALDIAYSRDLDKIFVVEQKGKIWMLPATDLGSAPAAAELLVDLDAVVKPSLESVLGMTIHPNTQANL